MKRIFDIFCNASFSNHNIHFMIFINVENILISVSVRFQFLQLVTKIFAKDESHLTSTCSVHSSAQIIQNNFLNIVKITKKILKNLEGWGAGFLKERPRCCSMSDSFLLQLSIYNSTRCPKNE